jgi:hypothetical protein
MTHVEILDGQSDRAPNSGNAMRRSVLTALGNDFPGATEAADAMRGISARSAGSGQLQEREASRSAEDWVHIHAAMGK